MKRRVVERGGYVARSDSAVIIAVDVLQQRIRQRFVRGRVAHSAAILPTLEHSAVTECLPDWATVERAGRTAESGYTIPTAWRN